MFFIILFFLSALSSVRCSGVGGKLLRPGYLHPLEGGGKLPRVRGIPRGIFTLEGRQTEAASFPVWGGGRSKLPRIQDKPVHRFGMLICTHCSLVHAKVHVHFYILVLRKGYFSIKTVYMYFKARWSMCARHFSFRYGD